MLRRPPPTDLAIAALGTALTEWVIWVQPTVGNPIAGQRWLTTAWPLLLDIPLAWRRSAPFTACLLVLTGITLQAALTGNSAEGLEVIAPVGIAVYSMAAYATRRRALAGLAALGIAYGLFTWFDNNVQTGQPSQEWSAAFFGVAFVTAWFAGVWLHSRREAEALAARTAGLEREATAAVAGERARMARELHDIVSHNLSVVVLQAAGARAGGATASTLEKIEQSGREALVEMRRLLGVLREDESSREPLTPQPGIAQLDELAGTVRAAGVPVDLTVAVDHDLPSAIELAAYRIVQEALTNVLKHAGHTRATVDVRLERDELVVTVADEGRGAAAAADGGHGLTGMRERVALFGGALLTGNRRSGGFEVQARFPVSAA